MTVEVSAATARRYVMGRSGLWPGRRWRGLPGTGSAMRALGDLQLDPLVAVARAHDLMLHSRVDDYAIDDWATLTYGRREFFEWGGWLAVRPMDELPWYRVLMRRERAAGHWREIEAEHGRTIDEMRRILATGREVSNREFAMRDRKRVDDYRGRKDSSLALHYLWRIGEAMVTRRERFERVYAATGLVAPASALVDIDDAVADDRLMRKMVAADGLTRMNGINYQLKRRVPPGELTTWRAARIDDGSVVEVRVEGWPAPLLAVATDANLLADLEAGRMPPGWSPSGPSTGDEVSFLSPLDPVSARGRARRLFGFDYTWDVYKPAHLRPFGYYTMPILWGDRLVGRFDPKLDRATGTLVINGLWLEDRQIARDIGFADALGRGMARFARFLGATRIDVAAVPQPALRKAIRGATRTRAKPRPSKS
ncbi:MAG: winged helix-turn-helix domain-containing protein [Chloroflexi bacterium]|nr:winged helix-turn-helix domain-containing protein [Chloroflexota bacterium]